MALISSIRNRSWILIVFIGIGLASFIMMDMFNSNTGAFGNRPTSTLGTINGQEIDYNKVRRTEDQTGQVDMARIAEVQKQIQSEREKINEPYIEELYEQVKKERLNK